MKYFPFFIILPVFFVSLQSCGSTGNSGTETEAVTVAEPSPRQAMRQASRSEVWRFVYCVEEGTDDAGLKDLLTEMAGKEPMGKRIEVVNCDAVGADDMSTTPVAIFGNRLPKGADSLPVSRHESGWQLAPGKRFGGEDVLFLPYMRNPWSATPGVAGLFVSANLPALVSRLKVEYGKQPEQMFWPNWAYELHRENGDLVYGSFAGSSWKFDPEAEISLKAPGEAVSEDGGIKIFAYDGQVSESEVGKVRKNLTLIRLLANTTLNVASDFYPEVHLYPSLERIGLRTGSMAAIQYNEQEKVLHLVPSFVSAEDLRLSFETWRPFVDWEGKPGSWDAAIALVQRQAGSALNGYAERLAEAQRLEAAGLTDMRIQENPSRYLEEARLRLQAGAVRSKAEGHLADDLRTLATSGDLNALPSTGTIAPATAPVLKLLPPTQTLAGMTFAHEGYRIHNGYGGEKIKPSLDSLGKLHVNALAIVPYTFMRNPNAPTTLSIPNDAGQENDWATMCSAREAHQRGWFTMLKPQIWIGGGHWPGDVDFATDEEWDTFFANYTYWIMHYAMLAEREQIGALCLGTELVQTTLKHPARWKEIIRKVRLVYGGQLTYAANWGEEFEGFTFWEEFDAIGLNSYYPLSEKDDPTDEELLNGARRWMSMAAGVSRAVDRPLWLTEVGFRSVDNAWVNPHADGGDRNVNGQAQARCFAALTTAATETPELKGMFIWKWPSYLGRTSRRGTGKEFSPGGKPAAKVLEIFNHAWAKR
ncbi:hypothetical protein FUA23_16230 [Neolewinella aurantiaca]|uniref:Asl1-like glycosyl hydrolase catalytic domain-containing protein n=1 Tax=Neolewinella aurantiaca TaxID=2602767 RepID=A0A5C7FB32_9BACT|nr:hypothetical protein [Neolewinella aurantiaca]TXF88029.1 hypothetical protein FUA23_16230 [Neolewinella aurantiaca]